MDALFRFPEAARHSPDVERWFLIQSPGLGDRAERWFNRLRACGPDVRELLHDGWPTACVEDVAFAYTAVHAAHVSLGFFRGAELPDPAGLLQGAGKRMRHVRLKPGEEVDEAALEGLIVAAYEDMKAVSQSATKKP
jgi:hypothetical protein